MAHRSATQRKRMFSSQLILVSLTLFSILLGEGM